MKILERVRLLPLLLIVAGLSFVIRFGEFVYGVGNMGAAYAQQEVNAEAPPLPNRPEVKSKEEIEKEKPQEPEEPAEEEMAEVAEEEPEEFGEPLDWRDASEAGFEYSEVQMDLYKDLSRRREEIERQEQVLARRAALLEAAERELNQKLREMTSIRREIERLLKDQSEEEKQRIISLVKIYEGMKAKDAANIFNTLDVDILVRVVSNMSERKLAPVMAEMDPDRARTVTILLAQQKQLPSLPPQ